MASRWILKTISRHSLLLSLSIILISGIIIGGCGTTKKASGNGPGTSTNSETSNADNTAAEASEQILAMIASNRSQLSDVYASRDNEIPEVFMDSSDRRDIDGPDQGYRIQILSTRNVDQADSIANDFRFWADSAMTGQYVPEAYVFFRQPYYKVHIGNFQFQDQALKIIRELKSRYPDAWVVHDEIDPHLVPADTTIFSNEK